jgi:hypothetical protein
MRTITLLTIDPNCGKLVCGLNMGHWGLQMEFDYGKGQPTGPIRDVQLIYIPPEQRANPDAYVAEEIRKYEEVRAKETEPKRLRPKQSRRKRSPRQSNQEIQIESKEESMMQTPEERHTRKCQICNHPELEAIEEAYIHWVKPTTICRQYDLSWAALYRHAEVRKLKPLRSQNLRSVLDKILERGVETEITGETVLKAVKYYVCLTDDNKWIEPSTQVVFSTKQSELAAISAATLALPSLPESGQTIDVALANLAAVPGDPVLIDTHFDQKTDLSL